MMTFEKKCFVSPEDIISVEFKCADCGSATTVPFGKLKTENVKLLLMSPCRHCHKETGLAENTQEFAALLDFNLILGRLAQTLKGRGIKYSFQIECSE